MFWMRNKENNFPIRTLGNNTVLIDITLSNIATSGFIFICELISQELILLILNCFISNVEIDIS